MAVARRRRVTTYHAIAKLTVWTVDELAQHYQSFYTFGGTSSIRWMFHQPRVSRLREVSKVVFRSIDVCTKKLHTALSDIPVSPRGAVHLVLPISFAAVPSLTLSILRALSRCIDGDCKYGRCYRWCCMCALPPGKTFTMSSAMRCLRTKLACSTFVWFLGRSGAPVKVGRSGLAGAKRPCLAYAGICAGTISKSQSAGIRCAGALSEGDGHAQVDRCLPICWGQDALKPGLSGSS